jgi:recombination protein RecA
MPEEIERLAKAAEDDGDTEKAAKIRTDFADKQVVIYLDYERTFDPEYAVALGLNCDEDHFILIQADSLEDGFNMIDPMVKSGSICCVIFDSDAAAPTNLDNESEVGSTGFNGAKGANTLKEVYKHFNILASNYLTPLLVVSQERANMNVMSHLPSQTGGTAIKFFSSTRNRITKIDELKDTNGNDAGIQIRVRNYKNKTGTPWRDAIMNLYFDRGFDSDAEYFDFLSEFGLITKGNGGVYSADFWNESTGVPTGKIRGAANALAWFQDPAHRDIYEQLKVKVNEKLMSKNELDADTVDPEKNEIAEIAKEKNMSAEKLAEEALKAANAEKALEQEVIENPGEETPPDLGL